VFSIFKKVLKDQRFGMGEIQVSGAAGILAASKSFVQGSTGGYRMYFLLLHYLAWSK
jgi:hypothetical protein